MSVSKHLIGVTVLFSILGSISIGVGAYYNNPECERLDVYLITSGSIIVGINILFALSGFCCARYIFPWNATMMWISGLAALFGGSLLFGSDGIKCREDYNVLWTSSLLVFGVSVIVFLQALLIERIKSLQNIGYSELNSIRTLSFDQPSSNIEEIQELDVMNTNVSV